MVNCSSFFKIVICNNIWCVITRSNRVTRWLASPTLLRGEVVQMKMFTFQDLILFATFLITLLAYIDRNHKRK